MYRITNTTAGKTYILHDQRDRNLRVIEPRLSLTVNKSGGLTFRITAGHMYYQTLKKLSSVISVLEDGMLIYEGRIISDETDLYNTKSVTCEGSLSYLIDSIQRPFSKTGNIRGFLEDMVESHNSQVEIRKQFQLGTINVTDENNELNRENTAVDNTWNILKTHLLDIHGGILWVSYQGGTKYLNYTHDMGGYNAQKIRFGVNLLDLTKYQDASNVITCLIPYGANTEYEDESGVTQTGTVDITSVNNGQDYIQASDSVIAEMGKIWGTYQWPDITDPARLKTVAQQFLEENSGIPDTLKVSAVDLAYIGTNIQRFQLGKYTTCISKPNGIQKDLLLTQLDIYMDDPQKGSISLGGTINSFTGQTTNKQVTVSKSLQQLSSKVTVEMDQKITNATALITGGLGGYVVIDNIDPSTGKQTQPWRILIMNTPDKNTATNVIQINQNGIGFSTAGINGPYRNAWTIDGNLVASFITSGTMLADRIRGGSLEIGGTGTAANGVITVKNASGTVIAQIDKNGITIKQGSIDLGNGAFKVTQNGVLTLEGTNNSSTIGCEVLSAGHAEIQGDLNVGSGAQFTGDVTMIDMSARDIQCNEIYSSVAGEWWSDRKLKRNIQQIPAKICLEIVRQLRPVSFVFKDNGIRSIGFIAQDVKKILKKMDLDLPIVNKHDGYFCIPYAVYVALLAGAVREQEKEISRIRREMGNNGRHQPRN